MNGYLVADAAMLADDGNWALCKRSSAINSLHNFFLFFGKSFCTHITDAFRANWTAKICHFPSTLKLLYYFSTLRFFHFHSTQLRSSNTRFLCASCLSSVRRLFSMLYIDDSINSTHFLSFYPFNLQMDRWQRSSNQNHSFWNVFPLIVKLKYENRTPKTIQKKILSSLNCGRILNLSMHFMVYSIYLLFARPQMSDENGNSRRNSYLPDLWLCCVAFRNLIYSVFINSAANKRKMGIHNLNSIQLSSWWIFRMLFLGTKWTEYEHKTGVHTVEKPLSQTHTTAMIIRPLKAHRSEANRAKRRIQFHLSANPVLSKSVGASGFEHTHTVEFMCPEFSYWWASIWERKIF